MLQSISLWLTILLIIPIAALFLAAAFMGRAGGDDDAAVVRLTRAQPWLFWGIVVVVTPVLLYTLTLLPYGAGSQAGDAQQVSVIGHMWYWEISEDEFRVGEPVHFNVTSTDVNHGFGVYDENLTLVGQTQAMPGYTNTLELTFEEPGTYRVLCLEYCGAAHHAMATELTVTE